MKKFSGLLIVMLMLVSGAYAATTDLVAQSWKVSAKPSVIDAKLDKEAVVDLIHKLDSEDAMIQSDQIGDYLWVDLDQDGAYELLVTVTPSCRFYNQLYVYKDTSQGKIRSQVINVWDLEKLDGVVKELDAKGGKELLLPIALTDYRGSKPLAIWSALYQWSGGKLQDVSAQYPDYYRNQILPKVEADIEAIERQHIEGVPTISVQQLKYLSEYYEENLAAQQMIKDRIARIAGDKKAGFDRAMAWEKSDNPNLRKDSVFVFSEIGDQDSIARLVELSKDASSDVAYTAKNIALIERYRNNH